jgi:hypothetical protein
MTVTLNWRRDVGPPRGTTKAEAPRVRQAWLDLWKFIVEGVLAGMQ